MAGPKTFANTQAQLASPNGLRAGAGFAAVSAGHGVEPLADLNGRPYVNAIASPPAGLTSRWQFPIPDPGFGEQVHTGAAVLEQASGYTTGVLGVGVETWVQFYDAVGIPAIPPFMEIPVIGAGTWAWAPGIGWGVALGLLILFSSTPRILTPVLAAGAMNATGWA